MGNGSVIDAIDELLMFKSTPIFVAIDGMCASGKTTLANCLHDYYSKKGIELNLFHMDDFFLRQEQRTGARLHEVGGNVDYERFQEEIIEPLCNNRVGEYRPYSCTSGEILEGTPFVTKRINIVEGSYSQHPFFTDIYNIRIYMETDAEEQKRRIFSRNGEKMLSRFVEEWIPKEKAYFDKYAIKSISMVVTT